MKRIHFGLLATLFVCAVAFVSCGDDDDNGAVSQPRVVTITFSDASATVEIPSSLASEVSAEVSGAYVTITNNGVGDETEFILSGSTSDGGFSYNGQYKTTLRLKDVNITSQQGAALNIQCGKRIALVLENGTENTLVDFASGAQKACLYCKGHLEIAGAGTLNVAGNLSHAIKSKEYLQLKKTVGTINITSAEGDAINVGQYFLQQGGEVNITNTTKGDGVQVEMLTLDDDITPDPDKENNGKVFIQGGKLNIVAANMDKKAIKADEMVTISGGELTLVASGAGSRGIQTDTDVLINEESGTTSINISVTGGPCTDPDDSDDPHRAMGIKADGDVTINAGTVTVTATGSKARTIRALTYTVSDNATVTTNLNPKIGQ